VSRPDHHDDPTPRRRSGILTAFRNNFLAGLVVIAPIGLTFWLVTTVLGWVDGVVWPFIPQAYHPQELVNRFLGREGADTVVINVRGAGVILFLIFTVLVGWIAKGLIGRSFIRWGEGLVDRMPIIRSVYNGLKQIAETVFSQSEASFDRACLVEYPRPGLWAVAFVSTSAKGEIAQKIPREDELLTVFLPTTPNPTSGFLLFVPKADVLPLDMSVEDAAKLVISAGLVYPADKKAAKAKAEAAAKAAREE
jgi:uncharacterized membrane protein